MTQKQQQYVVPVRIKKRIQGHLDERGDLSGLRRHEFTSRQDAVAVAERWNGKPDRGLASVEPA